MQDSTGANAQGYGGMHRPPGAEPVPDEGVRADEVDAGEAEAEAAELVAERSEGPALSDWTAEDDRHAAAARAALPDPDTRG
ncbi:hypothetical protein [Nakamurella endophytica]|uniref:Uncharacterized protein n=1 Tax=Nakamurella endophytica TaxID=1748367 RepID=A0A917WD89_9ACTN|nr:hypothetical protein [Nakamurella endophytica]GGL96349.1 hypothetical protein GCM10011594_15110 [Nakamurella endophytica]